MSYRLPALNASNPKTVRAPLPAPDALPVSDANRCYPPVARALDVPHRSINTSAGERVRGPLHIRTVNSRHRRIKDFLVPTLFPGRCHQGPGQRSAVVPSCAAGPSAITWKLSSRRIGYAIPTVRESSRNKRGVHDYGLSRL